MKSAIEEKAFLDCAILARRYYSQRSYKMLVSVEWNFISFWFLLLININIEPSVANGVFTISAPGHRLENFLIKEIRAANAIHCFQLCLREGPHCKSVNYGTKSNAKKKCQLNRATAGDCNLVNLVANKDFDYFEREVIGKKSFCYAPPKKAVHKGCADLYKDGEREDDVYRIDPDGQGAFEVRCDMSTNGGGWTVFQRRVDGSEDFYRGWSDYKNGFGRPECEFWLGLDKIHRLSKSFEAILRVDLGDFSNETHYAQYNTFAVADETDKYRLTVGNYSGNAGDSLRRHNGMRFSTNDNDNDNNPTQNCAESWKGGWWYHACFDSNLNGLYPRGPDTTDGPKAVNWENSGGPYFLKKTELKIRPRAF